MSTKTVQRFVTASSMLSPKGCVVGGTLTVYLGPRPEPCLLALLGSILVGTAASMFYGDRIPKSLRRIMSATSETAILPISVTAFNGQVNLVFQIYSSSCSKSRCESLL